ncbi:MAG: hypothetical protein ABIK68_22390 [bacterium]
MEKPKRYQHLHQRKISFNPNRTYIQRAVDKYLKNGGTISPIVLDENSYICFLSKTNTMLDADEFLLGI